MIRNTGFTETDVCLSTGISYRGVRAWLSIDDQGVVRRSQEVRLLG